MVGRTEVGGREIGAVAVLVGGTNREPFPFISALLCAMGYSVLYWLVIFIFAAKYTVNSMDM